MLLYKAVLFGLLTGSVLASPISLADSASALLARQSSGSCCVNACYTANAVTKALNAGFDDEQSGYTVGRNNYPHAFDDRESFQFSVSGPFYEFPILKSGRVFDGGESPGPDRVVFNDQGELAALVTHSGASGNNFDECS